MARGINKVILIGNLGADPEVRYMPQGGAVANLNLATSESWTDKATNERKEQTEWHRVVLYQRLAEIAGEYLRKGSKVYVEGRLKTRKWQDQQGVERYTTEIIANDLQMLDGRGENQGGFAGNPSAGQPQGGGYQQPAQQAAPAYQPPQQNYQKPAQPQGGYQQPTQNPQRTQAEPPIDFDDDIPF